MQRTKLEDGVCQHVQSMSYDKKFIKLLKNSVKIVVFN